MPRYAWFGFDPTDTQDQYAIVYNDFADKSGDDFVLWFDTEEQRAEQVKKDLMNEVIFLEEEKQNA